MSVGFQFEQVATGRQFVQSPGFQRNRGVVAGDDSGLTITGNLPYYGHAPFKYIDVELDNPVLFGGYSYHRSPEVRYLGYTSRIHYKEFGDNGAVVYDHWAEETTDLHPLFGDVWHYKREDDCLGVVLESTIHDDGTETHYRHPNYPVGLGDDCDLIPDPDEVSALNLFVETDTATNFSLVGKDGNDAIVWRWTATLGGLWTRPLCEDAVRSLVGQVQLNGRVTLSTVGPPPCSAGTGETVWFGLDPESALNPARHVKAIGVAYRRGCAGMIQKYSLLDNTNPNLISARLWNGGELQESSAWINCVSHPSCNSATAQRGIWRAGVSRYEVVRPQNTTFGTFTADKCGELMLAGSTKEFPVPGDYGLHGFFNPSLQCH